MLVQDPTRRNDVEAIFDQARRSGASGGPAENLLPSSSRNFTGTGRLLSGGTSSTPQQPEVLNHNITFWNNGFTVDDGPLRRLDDPENASFLEVFFNFFVFFCCIGSQDKESYNIVAEANSWLCKVREQGNQFY